MTTPYWAQWSHTELMSMQGVEIEDCHRDDNDYHDEEEAPEEHCCSGCMKCLGLSWRDFM